MAAARSMWKGHLKVKLVTVAVKLYNGEETSEGGIKFNQVHECGEGKVGLVGHKKTCKACAAEVSGDQIKKGKPIGDDKFVIISGEDIEKIKVESSHMIDVKTFVDPGEIPAAYYEKPYIISPNGEVGVTPYFLVRQSLVNNGKVGIAKVVLRDREDIAVVAPYGEKSLAAYIVRFPAEVRKEEVVPGIKDLEQPATPEFAEMGKFMDKLVNDMSGKFSRVMADKEFAADKYTTALKALVDARINNKEYSFAPEAAVDSTGDVMEALKASLGATATKSAAKESAKEAVKGAKPAAKRTKKVAAAK